MVSSWTDLEEMLESVNGSGFHKRTRDLESRPNTSRTSWCDWGSTTFPKRSLASKGLGAFHVQHKNTERKQLVFLLRAH